VSRLEDVDLSNIEYSDGKAMIQYRGSLIPLVPFDDEIDLNTGGRCATLIFSDGRRSMGLMVANIVDIMEDFINVQINSENDSCLGSAIINGQATDIISVGHYLGLTFGDWFADHGTEDFSDDSSTMDAQRSILLVDDSAFFRNMLSPILGVAGYSVVTADDPVEALALLENDSDFDVIVSDIEMPEMNGFQFAEELQKNPKWAKIPLVALTSHTTESDIKRGQDVGFDQYVAKFDRDTLLNAITETIRAVPKTEEIGVA
jgi:two-component system chemotaxis sensor kinase CheA